MSSSSTTTSPSVKRACDSCHRRKVKCIGEGTNPCRNCVSAGLNCTYNAIPQKKGPKGSRAKVLSELRENQRQSHLAPSAHVDSSINGTRSLPGSNLTRTPGLLAPEVLSICIEYYFANMYPTQPILHRQRLQEAILSIDHSTESYVQLCALCAYVLFQPDVNLPPTFRSNVDFSQMSASALGHLLLDEAIRVRKGYEFIEKPTITTIYTSYFIFCAYFCLDRQNAAWCYLREALTLAHVIGLHDEERYKTDDYISSSRKRRMFWMLFISERSYAFKRHRPLTLYPTIQLPTNEDDPTEIIDLTGFICLIKLYKPFDETFFGLWNRTKAGAEPAWLSQLQRQLTDALPTYLKGLEIQIVDVRMSQLWLRTMVWQLAISHGFISSMTQDDTLSFRYPIEISRELVELSQEFSQEALRVHGIGMIEKLFDIACTLVDVMSCVPMSPETFDAGPREYLNRIISLISSLRGDQTRYLPLLHSKVSEVLPSYRMPALIQQSLASSVYGTESSASSVAGPDETSPYETAQPLAMRQPDGLHALSAANMHFQAQSLSNQLAQITAYSAFSTAVTSQGATTTIGGIGTYQTHMPAGGPFTG